MRELFEPDDCLQYALAGGDDYELLFTLAPERAAALLATLPLQQRLTQIGVMTADSAVHCLREGQPFRIQRAGYDHFAAGSDPT
jgi:thiamine-monophosphate kinase